MFAINVDRSADIFAGVKGALGDLSPVMSSFAGRLYQSIMENFSAGGRPAWPPLTPEYLARKTRAGYPPDILVSTGALRASVKVEPGNLSVTARSGLPYAGVHQFGGHGALARPFLTMGPGDEEELARMVADYITGENR